MPTIADLLSSQINPPDPNDQLRDPLGQGQTLQGLAQIPGQGAAPPPDMSGGTQPVAPSPNVPGPLAALAPPPGKPKIKLKTGRQGPKPKIKLKTPPPGSKPRIKLKALANV